MLLEPSVLDPGVTHELLIDAASDAILSIDLETHRIVRANHRLESMTGHPLDTLLGQPASILTPTTAGVRFIFCSELYCTPGLYEEVAVARVDGFVSVATVRVGKSKIEGHPVAVCVVRDETERRMIERELITKHLALAAAHQELEQRVAELRTLSETLETKNREIGALSTMMATVSRQAMLVEVVAEVAHSMNNPLGALMSSLRMLAGFDTQISSEPDRQRHGALISRCREASQRMAHVVDELRNACRNGGASDAETVCDLSEQTEKALALFAHRLDHRVRLEKVWVPGVYAHVPADQVHHAIVNMVDNALQAIGHSGTVRIECSKDDANVIWSISDSGPGVPADIEGSIFDPFFTTKPTGLGSGLGLSMVRRLVARHGGSVSVEGHGLLGGAVFRMKLRAATEPSKATETVARGDSTYA